MRKILESIQGHEERPTMNKVQESVTHLRDQSCQVCSCQWDIAGKLDQRPNGRGDKHRAERDPSAQSSFLPPNYIHAVPKTLMFLLATNDECLLHARHMLRVF